MTEVATVSSGRIECEALTKVYGDGTKALDALDLAVEPGHVLAPTFHGASIESGPD